MNLNLKKRISPHFIVGEVVKTWQGLYRRVHKGGYRLPDCGSGDTERHQRSARRDLSGGLETWSDNRREGF